MRITDKYVFFWDGPWSNWATSSFQFEDMKFNCVEQWMMYHKAITFNDEESAKLIMGTDSPRAQKDYGRTVDNYDEKIWSAIRYSIVLQGVWLKIEQNPTFKKQLLEDYGEGRTFVEASPYDTIWGIGMGVDYPGVDDEANWKGQNLLGKALTEVAQNLVKET
jgi:hypothetical protein